jgi:hypothetical protein
VRGLLQHAVDLCWLRGLYAGFFIPYAQMPKWWSWFYWLDPLSYMIYGVITRCGDSSKEVASWACMLAWTESAPCRPPSWLVLLRITDRPVFTCTVSVVLSAAPCMVLDFMGFCVLFVLQPTW